LDLQALNQHVIDTLQAAWRTTDPRNASDVQPRCRVDYGRAARVAIGRPIDEVLQPVAHVAGSLSADERVWRTPTGLSHRPVDGRSEIELDLTATHLENTWRQGRVSLLLRRLTSIRKLELDGASSSGSRRWDEMAAGIAHEIRNRWRRCRDRFRSCGTDLPLTTEQEQLMDIVLRDSERLNTTIRSFLAYARPQRFRSKLRCPPIAQRHGAVAPTVRSSATATSSS